MNRIAALPRLFSNRRLLVSSGFLLLGMTCFAFTGNAAELTVERQASLQNIISSYLSAAGPNLKQDGTLTIEPKGTYYQAILPRLSAADPNGKRVDLGTPRLNARPSETDNSWNTTLALPQEIQATQNGQVISKLSLGSQKFDGTLVEGANAFTTIDATYTNVILTDIKNNSMTKIGTFTIDQNGKKTDDNHIVGPVRLTADALSLLANSASPLNIEKVTLSGTVEDIDALLQHFVVKKEGDNTGFTENKRVKMNIYGLDKAASAVRLSGGIPTAEQQKVIATLAVLQLAGQKQKEADIRAYDLEITPAGKFFVNGTDLSALF